MGEKNLTKRTWEVDRSWQDETKNFSIVTKQLLWTLAVRTADRSRGALHKLLSEASAAFIVRDLHPPAPLLFWLLDSLVDYNQHDSFVGP